MSDSIVMIKELQVANTLGESVLWDDESLSFWWTDIEECTLYQYSIGDERLQSWKTPHRVASFGLIKNDTRLIVAFDRGIALYDLHSGITKWMTPKSFLPPGLRLNDGRVDPEGNFCVGSMVEDATLTDGSGKLYFVDHAFQVSVLLSGLQISNGLGWSPDGMRVYHTDSPTATITVQNYPDLVAGKGRSSVFARTPPGVDPDGATVDASGCLWSANWQGASVTRYSPNSKVLAEIKVPATQPTCVAFGGRNLDLLMVTSARKGLTPRQLASEPAAGNVFLFQTNFTGIPERRFVLRA